MAGTGTRARAEAPALPPPSAELVLLRVFLESFVTIMGPKKAERFLRMSAERLASEENLANILPIRPHSDDAALSAARQSAMLWMRQMLPILMARLQ